MDDERDQVPASDATVAVHGGPSEVEREAWTRRLGRLVDGAQVVVQVRRVLVEGNGSG